MKYIAIVTLGLLLTACQSEEEKKADFIKYCSGNDFTPKQCEVLYMIAKSSSDARDSATAASISSGIAMGVAAGSVGRR